MTIYFDEVVLYFDEGICKDCPKIFYKINTIQSFGKEKKIKQQTHGSDIYLCICVITPFIKYQ